ANRVCNLVAFVAHVRRVQTTVTTGNTRERNNLVSLRIRSGNVDQSGRETDGAVLHSLLDDTLHLLQLFGRGRAIAESHDFATHRTMRDERGEINGQRLLFYATKKLRDFSRRRSTVSGDERGHAHAHEVFRGRLAVDRFDVRVHID